MHTEPCTHATVGKIRGSQSPFWGAFRPISTGLLIISSSHLDNHDFVILATSGPSHTSISFTCESNYPYSLAMKVLKNPHRWLLVVVFWAFKRPQDGLNWQWSVATHHHRWLPIMAISSRRLAMGWKAREVKETRNIGQGRDANACIMSRFFFILNFNLKLSQQ